MSVFNKIWQSRAIIRKQVIRYLIIFGALFVLISTLSNLLTLRDNSNDIKSIVTSLQDSSRKQKQQLDNQSKIINNLAQAVKDLKKDNKQQTDYIQCLLGLQGHLINECYNEQTNVVVRPQSAPQATPENTKPAPKSNKSMGGAKNAPTTTPTTPQNQNIIDRLLNQLKEFL